MSKEIIDILVLAGIGFIWLFLNLKAGPKWLRMSSLVITLGFLGAASLKALLYVVS